MAKLSLDNIPKVKEPAVTVEKKIEPTTLTITKSPAMEMQEIQQFIKRNEAIFKQRIDKIIEEQLQATLKYERDEYKKNLELAQTNIELMKKCIDLSTETVKSENSTSIKLITDKVERLEASNKIVTTTINSESKKLIDQSHELITMLGSNAKDTVEKSLKLLDNNFKTILDEHKAIASTVRDMYQFRGVWTIVRWFMVFTSWMMIMTLTKALSGGTWGGLFKAMIGLRLFFGD